MSYRVNDALIDARDQWDGFYNISVVLLTHAHFDHIYGPNRVIELNPTSESTQTSQEERCSEKSLFLS